MYSALSSKPSSFDKIFIVSSMLKIFSSDCFMCTKEDYGGVDRVLRIVFCNPSFLTGARLAHGWNEKIRMERSFRQPAYGSGLRSTAGSRGKGALLPRVTPNAQLNVFCSP